MQVYLLISIAVLIMIFLLFRLYAAKVNTENYKLITNIDFLSNEIERLTVINKDLQQQYNEEVEAKFLSMQKEALAMQKCQALEEKITTWEEQKQQSIEHAKAAIFDVGNKLSNQLIEQHKRETLLQQETTQKHFKQTTEILYKDFSKLTEIIAGLKEQVTVSHNTTDMVYKALLAPNTVGGLAEITLENILKASNLLPDIDYQMQYSITDQENNRLRPDAVIFLPGDNILVIDSKASKFFLELGQTIDKNLEQELKQKIKSTMRNHLKSLTSKDYRQAIATHFNNRKINHISTVMFLPTETSIERLQDIDSQLISDAWQSNIFPAGPIGLVNILAHSKFQISEGRKNENYHKIIEEVSSLLYSVANLTVHAKKLGNSIYNSMSYFDKFAASFNSNLINKSKRLEKLGVTVKTNKQIPDKLDRYQVISGTKMTMIEGESVEEENNNE